MTIATILPTARTVFLDTNDNPLAGGKVYMFVPPNTTTPKTTWQDATGAIANSHPIILDADGSALIYGSGQYLQEVFDADDNLVYTGLTQDVYGLIVNGNNTFTGNNIFEGTSTFTGGFVLPDDYVTNAMLANMQANTVKLNNTASLANPVDFELTASVLLGRGSTGNIAKITLGTGLSMVGTVLTGPSPFVVVFQVFTASATYTPTTGMKYCIVEAVGAGGGGGGGANAGGGVVYGAGGGGSGAYGRSVFAAAAIGASKAVTIGAGGAGGANTGTNGTTGGTTTFGALISCTGGGGGGGTGTGGVNGLYAPGGGGTATGSSLMVPGHPGFYGISFWGSDNLAARSVSGRGADSAYGAGGPAKVNTGGAGNAATGYGAGGGGADGSITVGGAGTSGLVLITEFIQV